MDGHVPFPAMSHLIKACVSRSALRHNVQLLMSKAGGVPLCAMIKADAYGHGVAVVTRALSDLGISFWGVATVEEAVKLHELNLDEPILVLRPVGLYQSECAAHEETDLMAQYAFRATVVNEQGLDLLAKRAAKRQKNVHIHIKIDTGMGRNGCPQEEAVDFVLKASQTTGISLEGIYSHFASADARDLDFAREQITVFQTVLRGLESRGIHVPIKHLANSAAIFNLPSSRLDMVRPGLALYGYRGPFVKDSEELIPVLKVIAPVLVIKWIKKGRSCGYGSTFVAKRDTRAGLLPVGYADGYSRRLSNVGQIDIKGRPAPVIGRVSMDLTVVDLTDVPEADVGTEVTIISDRRDAPHSVESLAKQLETIPHEITSVLGPRIQRVMVD
ncbi:alanine racemase [Verrucomicrobiota bacterium]